MKRPWRKHTNEDLALNLEVWMMMDGRLTTEDQKEFFEEVIWRLLMSSFETKKEEIQPEGCNCRTGCKSLNCDK